MIRDASGEALEDLRSILGMLRDEEAGSRFSAHVRVVVVTTYEIDE